MKPSRILALALCGSSLLCAADTYTIALIPKGSTHEHWKTVNAGAVKAQRELKERGVNVDVMWQAPLREDDRDYQIRVVENLVARKVNGICIAPLDSKALVPPINTATRAKIPVIVMSYGYTPTAVHELGADIVLDDFAELPSAVARLMG